MRRRSRFLAVALAACALAVTSCGDDDSDDVGGGGGADGGSAYGGGAGKGGDDETSGGGGGGATRLKLTADPGGALEFDKSSLSTKPGRVTVVLENPSGVPHAIEVEGQGVEGGGETVGKGETSEVTVDLEKGEYEYYCPVGNHKDAGMEGTLTVR